MDVYVKMKAVIATWEVVEEVEVEEEEEEKEQEEEDEEEE